MPTSNKMLFCFDFDKTIVNGHFHNHLAWLGVPHKQATAEQIQAMLQLYGILNVIELLNTFRLILQQGHYLAITTWGEYPEVIKPTLETIGLNEDEIKQIHIENGIPIHLEVCKSEHIHRAKRHFQVTNNANVFLIDDDEKNINQAIKEGQHGIHVKSPHTSIDYLQKIQTVIKDLQQEGKENNDKRATIKILLSSYKASLKGVLIAGLVGLALGFCGAPFMLAGFVFLMVLGGLYWHRNKIVKVQESLRKNETRWMKDNAAAYELGYQSKNWLPYLKSYVQPKAYWHATAYQIGLEEALANKPQRQKI